MPAALLTPAVCPVPFGLPAYGQGHDLGDRKRALPTVRCGRVLVMNPPDRPFSDVRRTVQHWARSARERAVQLGVLRNPAPRRPHQELAETAMALLTLWTTFEDTESDSVAATTRTLLAGHTSEELGYLVLHLAGLSRGLAHVLVSQQQADINEALQMVGRDVHERRAGS